MPRTKTRPSKRETQKAGDAKRADLSLAVADEEAQAHLVLAWRDSPPFYTAQYVEIDQDVSAQFLELARDAATSLLQDRTFIPYDAEWPLKPHEYFELVGDEIPAPELFEDLADFLDLDTFHRRALKKPRLYVVAVQSPDGTAYFGKRMANLKVLGRQRGTFAATWDGNTFSKLDQSVATFARDFDWVVWDDSLFVFNAKRFHAEFRDTAAVRAAVEAHVMTITQHVRIRNADAFVERCKASVPMASKLAKVAQAGIWKQPIDKLKGYATQYDIDVEWDGDALVFDGRIETQWAILKLLDEDRTQGPVSGRKFESSAKRTV